MPLRILLFIDYYFIAISATTMYLMIEFSSFLTILGGILMVVMWIYRIKKTIEKDHKGNILSFILYFFQKIKK